MQRTQLVWIIASLAWLGCSPEPNRETDRAKPKSPSEVDAGPDVHDAGITHDEGGSQDVDSGPEKRAGAEVGPAGGEIAAPGGNLKINVPPGALDVPVMVSVTLSEITPPSDIAAYSPVFKFEPDGLTFKEPITVRFDVEGDEALATVYWTKPDSDEFEAIGGDVHDGVIEVQVSHFSSGFCGANACRRDLKNDPDHCGRCDHACPGPHGARACREGICSLTCDAGYADCDGDKSTGCEQPLSTASHCGTCGTQCADGFACNVTNGSGYTCADIDECTTDNGGCTGGRHCVNTEGGRSCDCPAGTIWNGSACLTPTGPPAPPTHYLIGARYSSIQEEVIAVRSDDHTLRVVGILGDLASWAGKAAISRDGTTLYAYGYDVRDDPKLYVFDLSTGSLTRTVSTNADPNHLARVLDAQGRMIGLNYGDATCSVVAVDPADASVTLLSDLGDRCTGDAFAPMVLSRDGNTLIWSGWEVTATDPEVVREPRLHRFDLTQNVLAGSAPDATQGAYLAGVDAANRLIGLRWNGSAEEVVAIDTTTGSAQPLGILGDLQFWQSDNSAIPPSGDRLYVLGQGVTDSKVYAFDLVHDMLAGDFPDTLGVLKGALDAPVNNRGQLYFTDPEHGGGIYRANRDGTAAAQIISFETNNAEAISADTSKIYYSATGAEGVWRANLDGSNPEQIVPSIYPAWTLHATATHLYFTDAETGGVYRSNKDGTGAAQIIDLQGDNAAAISSDSQYLYYSGNHAEGVWRSNLDGTNPEQIVESIYPAWQLHATATHLYFTDPEHGGGVYKANKDGTGAVQIVDLAGANAEGLFADDQSLYYSGAGAEGLWRADLHGTDPDRIVESIYTVRAICINP